MAALALLVPAVVAAAVVGLGRVAGAGRGGAWWAATAVGLAYFAGHVAIRRPPIPPVEVTDQLLWLALAAAGLALIEAAWPGRRLIRIVGRPLLAALTLWLVLGPAARAGELKRVAVVWLTASALAAWADLEVLAALDRGGEVFRALLVTAAGSAVAMVLSGSIVVGMLALALMSALAAARLAAWPGPLAGFLPPAAAVLTGLLLDGFVYASLHVPSALLLAAAPAASWLTRLGPLRKLGPRSAAVLQTVAVLIQVAVAVGLAFQASAADEYP
jgi:hypothetical protein